MTYYVRSNLLCSLQESTPSCLKRGRAWGRHRGRDAKICAFAICMQPPTAARATERERLRTRPFKTPAVAPFQLTDQSRRRQTVSFGENSSAATRPWDPPERAGHHSRANITPAKRQSVAVRAASAPSAPGWPCATHLTSILTRRPQNEGRAPSMPRTPPSAALPNHPHMRSGSVDSSGPRLPLKARAAARRGKPRGAHQCLQAGQMIFLSTPRAATRAPSARSRDAAAYISRWGRRSWAGGFRRRPRGARSHKCSSNSALAHGRLAPSTAPSPPRDTTSRAPNSHAAMFHGA